MYILAVTDVLFAIASDSIKFIFFSIKKEVAYPSAKQKHPEMKIRNIFPTSKPFMALAAKETAKTIPKMHSMPKAWNAKTSSMKYPFAHSLFSKVCSGR